MAGKPAVLSEQVPCCPDRTGGKDFTTLAETERTAIAHLLRRAAFGARPNEVEYYVRKGYAAAVDDLVAKRPLAGGAATPKSLKNFLTRELAPYNEANLRALQTTFMESLVTSATPLVERMTLFFHDHFATPFRPGEYVGAAELFTQTELFRQHALGNWGSLLHGAIEDVALACSLDADKNNARKPNENLAREFMELFTLGGGYSEADIREAARALSGYRVTPATDGSGRRYKLALDAAIHDNGDKSIFGRRGNFGAHEFVNLVLDQPGASRFLARKLATSFAMPNPPSSLVSQIATSLTASRWNLGEAMRALFLSSEFRSAAARNALVKSPVELAAGTLRAFKSKDYGFAVDWAHSAGQSLYQPPNVGGWVGNEAWLSAGGLLNRYSGAAAFAARTVHGSNYVRGDSLDRWAALMGMTELAPATRASLNRYLRGAATWGPKDRDRSLMTLLIASPDYSLA